jgi:hypothetical protein
MQGHTFWRRRARPPLFLDICNIFYNKLRHCWLTSSPHFSEWIFDLAQKPTNCTQQWHLSCVCECACMYIVSEKRIINRHELTFNNRIQFCTIGWWLWFRRFYVKNLRSFDTHHSHVDGFNSWMRSLILSSVVMGYRKTTSNSFYTL